LLLGAGTREGRKLGEEVDAIEHFALGGLGEEALCSLDLATCRFEFARELAVDPGVDGGVPPLDGAKAADLALDCAEGQPSVDAVDI